LLQVLTGFGWNATQISDESDCKKVNGCVITDYYWSLIAFKLDWSQLAVKSYVAIML